jgi:hypothetical protein
MEQVVLPVLTDGRQQSDDEEEEEEEEEEDAGGPRMQAPMLTLPVFN